MLGVVEIKTCSVAGCSHHSSWYSRIASGIVVLVSHESRNAVRFLCPVGTRGSENGDSGRNFLRPLRGFVPDSRLARVAIRPEGMKFDGLLDD